MTTANLLVYGEIASLEAHVRDVQRSKAQEIVVNVNSNGGDPFSALGLYYALRSHPARITTICDGLAASAASLVFLAGDRRIVQPGALVMVHEPYGMSIGDAATHGKTAADLDKIAGEMARVYAQACGGTAERWRSVMKAETWFNDTEAIAAGLAHERGADMQIAASARRFDLSRYRNAPRVRAAANYQHASGLEPTAAEIAIGRAMGNDTNDPKWRKLIVANRVTSESTPETRAQAQADLERNFASWPR